MLLNKEQYIKYNSIMQFQNIICMYTCVYMPWPGMEEWPSLMGSLLKTENKITGGKVKVK